MADKSKEQQFELASPPFDGVSSVRFSPITQNHLLVASWDTTVRFYDVAANEQRCKFDHRAAVLDCCFAPDGRHAYSGGLDTSVREFDLETEKFRHLGQHGEPISRLCYSKEANLLITGSWDRTLRLWDPRSPSASSQSTPHSLPERVYSMDITPDGRTLVVALASRLFHIYDMRKLVTAAPYAVDEDKLGVQKRDSSLKFLTRSVACMADGQGYASGSVEGRIAVEYFDSSAEAQDKKYAFKCHRQTVNGEDHVWPVNALAFHPVYNTFASGGSDGTISLWDHISKKRLRQYAKYNNAVTSLSFSPDGALLACGVSYNWDEGAEGARGRAKPGVWIRTVGEEGKPKGWTG